MPVILLTGGSGQIGFELQRELSTLGRVVSPTSRELDLSSDSIIDRVRVYSPDIIVNAGAYTAVDAAEKERARCYAINAAAPGVLALEMKKSGGLFVHYSTDYVFDGWKNDPYSEEDVLAPLSVYGESKAEGERRVTSAGGRYFIFRTSWIYGTRGKNFFRTILGKARTQPELRVVSDQIGSPTWSRMVAIATAQVLAKVLADRGAPKGGIYHMTAEGSTTWYDFARKILAYSSAGASQNTVVTPIPTEAYPLPASRPRYSVLDNTKLAKDFGISLPHWSDQLRLASSEKD
jgi:dTDP-4-dehydrorhamnose reductase